MCYLEDRREAGEARVLYVQGSAADIIPLVNVFQSSEARSTPPGTFHMSCQSTSFEIWRAERKEGKGHAGGRNPVFGQAIEFAPTAFVERISSAMMEKKTSTREGEIFIPPPEAT